MYGLGMAHSFLPFTLHNNFLLIKCFIRKSLDLLFWNYRQIDLNLWHCATFFWTKRREKINVKDFKLIWLVNVIFFKRKRYFIKLNLYILIITNFCIIIAAEGTYSSAISCVHLRWIRLMNCKKSLLFIIVRYFWEHVSHFPILFRLHDAVKSTQIEKKLKKNKNWFKLVGLLDIVCKNRNMKPWFSLKY